MRPRAWIVRITEREDLCFGKGIVAIGWAEARDLDQPGLDRNGFKLSIRASYPDYTSNQALGQVVGSLWRFIREIKAGDWILAPTWTGLNIGQVTGPLAYDESLVVEDSAWRYPVQWIRRDISRDSANAPLQARCCDRHTCVDATDLLTEIERLSSGEAKASLETAIAGSEAYAAIGRVLDDYLTPNDLELLVLRLAEKNGAKAEQPPKNLPNKKGDVDVIARYEFPRFAVGYQVKKHADKSETDEWAVQQILDALEDEQLELDIGCVVSTGKGFTAEAMRLAKSPERGEIRLIARDDFLHWVLSAGISRLH